MNAIFRLIISLVVFILALYVVGSSLNVLAILITGESDPFDAHLRLGDTNIFLGTLVTITGIVIPVFLAYRFYRSNLLRKKDERTVRPVEREERS